MKEKDRDRERETETERQKEKRKTERQRESFTDDVVVRVFLFLSFHLFILSCYSFHLWKEI